MPVLKRKNPCGDCPFRRNAIKGWLGASSPLEFLSATLVAEHEMPCHMDIDYSDPDWEDTQLPEASLCAGALQMFKNQMKSPRNPKLTQAVKGVETNPEVFRHGQEFYDHHATSPMAHEDPPEIQSIAVFLSIKLKESVQ